MSLLEWRGRPRVGDRITVRYDLATGWAKDAGLRAPGLWWVAILVAALFFFLPWLSERSTLRAVKGRRRPRP